MQYAANLNKKNNKYNEFCAKKCIWKCETSMDMTIFFILLFFFGGGNEQRNQHCRRRSRADYLPLSECGCECAVACGCACVCVSVPLVAVAITSEI